jgi:hypothetical protein
MNSLTGDASSAFLTFLATTVFWWLYLVYVVIEPKNRQIADLQAEVKRLKKAVDGHQADDDRR